MKYDLHAPTGSGIKQANGRLRKLVLTAENVSEQEDLGRMAAFAMTYQWPNVAPPQGDSCEWTAHYDGSDTWAGDCGVEWTFFDGGPAENRMRFCPGCGKPATEAAETTGEATQ